MMKRSFYFLSFCVLALVSGGGVWAVKTTVVTQSTEQQFKGGKTTRTVISSEGEITLAYQTENLLGSDPNVWTVNAIVADTAGNIYAGTSGSGYIYRIGPDKASKIIYGKGKDDQKHVFSLVIDPQGRLLAGTGGQAGLLLRFDADADCKTLFKDEQIKYIWSIILGPAGRMYLGTGPGGKVFTLDSDGSHAEMLYQTKEDNILSLALDAQGILYAGGDKNGMVYRIDPATRTATIAYDTDQKEISGLIFDKAGNLFIATGDARPGREQGRLPISEGDTARPEAMGKEPIAPLGAKPVKPGEVKAKTVAADEDEDDGDEEVTPPAQPPTGEEAAKERSPEREIIPPEMVAGPPRPMRGGNFVYKMTPGGFITPVFNKPIVIFSMAYDPDNDQLIFGTGNEGQLFRVDITKEESEILYSAKPSAQVSAVFRSAAGLIYAGLSNPAGVFSISPKYAAQGEYLSSVIDAQQVSLWGRLDLDAKVPTGGKLTIATRTGNTKDPDEGPWQSWSEPVIVSQPIVSIPSAAGRFLQYRLNLESQDGKATPTVCRVTVASLVPNLPPKVATVTLAPVVKKALGPKTEATAASGSLRITWKAEDPNRDQLRANVYLRTAGGEKWIRIAKELKETASTFNTNTTADGRYEFKVDVTDLPDNPPDQALTDSRISRPIVIDNTPPEISEFSFSLTGDTLSVRAVVTDALTPIGEAGFCLDGEEPWRMVLPEDKIFDDLRETVSFSVTVDKAGEHLLAVYFADALGNKIYRNVTVTHP
jgi:hypothetical protein